MKRCYWSLGSSLLFIFSILLILLVCWRLFLYDRPFESSIKGLVFVLLLLSISVFFYWFSRKEPLCIREKEDCLVFYYTTFIKKTIKFVDILSYQYPVSKALITGEKCVVHRLVLKEGKEIILSKYSGLKDFALRWRLAHKSDNEPVSHYIPNNKNLSFKHKYLYDLETYAVLFGLGVWCLDVWKIIEGYGSSYHYIMLFLLLFCVYGFTRRYTSFYIADNMFIMTNYLVPRLNVSIPMSEIKWMMFQDEIVICKNNGDSIIAYHKLSDDQLMEFEAEVRAMGIVVVR